MNPFRSHLTAFGVGAGLVILLATVAAVAAPGLIHFVGDDDDDGVHILNIGDDDGGSFAMSEKGEKFTAKWKGDFSFAADARSLAELGRSLEIEMRNKKREEKALFKKKDGEIAIEAWRDGDKLHGEAASKAAADLLQQFARSSGVKASARVKALINDGGKQAALKEVALLKSGHGAAAYIEALSENARLDDAEIETLAQQIGGLDGDYAKRLALAAILKAQAPDEKAMNALLAAAKKVDGDHELRLLIEELADQPGDKSAFRAAYSLLGDIKGDHEIRLASEAILEADGVSNADAAKVIEAAARSIKGDYDLRLVVDAADERLKDEAVASAAVAAASAIKGGHERRLAVEDIADELASSSPAWLALIDAASGVDGDHDRRLAIQAVAEAAPKTEQIKLALQKAVASISSEHERDLAEEVLN